MLGTSFELSTVKKYEYFIKIFSDILPAVSSEFSPWCKDGLGCLYILSVANNYISENTSQNSCQSYSSIQEFENTFSLFQSFPGLIFLFFCGRAFLLPGCHDATEGLHDLIIGHSDPLAKLLFSHLFPRQPTGSEVKG